MKVLLGLSGGVDSAVAAYLLMKQGYEVSCCFMRNWDALANGDYLGNPTVNDSQCPQEKDYDDAKAVAEKLGLPLLRADFVKEYWDNVFSYFLKEYEKGRTPNPDVFCNRYIKFDSFRKFAKEHGFDTIAMGHYADKEFHEGHWHIKKAKDRNKDQSYFLCKLTEDQIASCLFPLGNIEKKEVREIARNLGLSSVMDKKDSTGICFIGERNFKEFLKNYLPSKEGKIVDGKTLKEIGTHQGVLYYTIGQRHGLGIGGISGEDPGAYFVYKKDVKNNILYVTKGDEEPLYSDLVHISEMTLIGEEPKENIDAAAKFRYRQSDQFGKFHLEGDKGIMELSSPSKAVTPGQVAAIYKGDILLGGGIIEESYYKGNPR